jgi:guanylate kinase
MKGKIVFISGPSGVGKGTLIDQLRQQHPDWIFPPSCTTRDPRPGEIDGETYFFISPAQFQKKVNEGEFLEHAIVHGGNSYGTLRQPLLDGVEKGKTVVREFDVQGFAQARETLPKDIYISIFLKPADGLEVLVQRIQERAPITDIELAKRIESMKKELAQEKYYDYTVLSEHGDIDAMTADAEAIILSQTTPGS